MFDRVEMTAVHPVPTAMNQQFYKSGQRVADGDRLKLVGDMLVTVVIGLQHTDIAGILDDPETEKQDFAGGGYLRGENGVTGHPEHLPGTDLPVRKPATMGRQMPIQKKSKVIYPGEKHQDTGIFRYLKNESTSSL